MVASYECSGAPSNKSDALGRGYAKIQFYTLSRVYPLLHESGRSVEGWRKIRTISSG